MVDRLGVEGAELFFTPGEGGTLTLRARFREATCRKGDLDGAVVEEGLLEVAGLEAAELLDRKGPLDLKDLLRRLVIRVHHLRVRVAGLLLERALETVQEELAQRGLCDLRFVFGADRLTVKGQVKKGITMPFAVDLKLRAADNRLLVVFDGFWLAEMVPLPGMVRKLILTAVRGQLAPGLRDVVTFTDDRILLNPWPRVPVDLGCEFRRFDLEGQHLVLELAAAPSASPPAGERAEAVG